jgi:hypothetical protein
MITPKKKSKQHLMLKTPKECIFYLIEYVKKCEWDPIFIYKNSTQG